MPWDNKDTEPSILAKEFFSALAAAGLPQVPQDFSVVPLPQVVPRGTLMKIDPAVHAGPNAGLKI